jgi:polar amino acid transport system substrate-binding protein
MTLAKSLSIFALATSLFLPPSLAGAQQTGGYWKPVQDRGVLRCGAAVAPPHVMRDPTSGEYSGLFIDLCKELAEKVLGVKAEIIDTSWDNIVAGLQADRWDVSLALNRTPKRALAMRSAIVLGITRFHWSITNRTRRSNLSGKALLTSTSRA